MAFRIEKDTMGEVQVPADKYWAAQTERSRNNFKIGPAASMPHEIIEAFGYLKKAAAFANCDLGVLPAEKRDLIATACDEILAGKLDDQFPLVIWQTGSGTQSNMNVNEVVANRVHVLHGGKLGEKSFVHPNDDVNKSQSSNDTFPTAMHIAAYKKVVEHTIPCVERLQKTFAKNLQNLKIVVKIGPHSLNGCNSINIRSRILCIRRTIRFRFTCTKKYPSTLKPISTWWYCCGYWFEHTKRL